MSGITRSIILQKIPLLGQTAAFSFFLPPKCVLREVLAFNNTANAVTGGLKFGTSSGAVDIIAALAVGASSTAFAADAALLKRFFSPTARQQIFIDAVTSWNSANVDLYILYQNLANG